MKKLVALTVVAILALALGAGALATAQLPNPMVEVDGAQAIEAQLSVELPLPAGATTSAAYVIGDEVGQVDFSWNGCAYSYRVKKSEALEDISGMYIDFAHVESVEFDGLPVTLSLNANAEGMTQWFKDGASYTLIVAEGATEDKLFDVLIDILYA